MLARGNGVSEERQRRAARGGGPAEFTSGGRETRASPLNKVACGANQAALWVALKAPPLSPQRRTVGRQGGAWFPPQQ